jgi:hypothetical protein
MKRKVLLFAVFILFRLSSFCQGDTIPEPGKLYLDFRNTNFIRDDEYSNPIIEGYTLIGYFIQPSLVYSPSQKIILKLGAHLLGYSGTNKISLFKPVFSTTFSITRGLSLVAGTLTGSDTHRMLDPHFNKERSYNDYSEDGVQFRFENKHFFNDTWVSWEHFIFKGDKTREMFTAGESFNWASGPIGDFLRIEIPVQLQFKHYGGQISNYPEQVETYFNTAVGISGICDLKLNKRSDIGISYYLFNGKCVTLNSPSGINSGYGQWYRLFVDYSIVHLEGGYWRSHDFYAPNGNFIFSSVSDHMPGVIISDRKIITCSAGVSARPGDIFGFYLGFDGYYDTVLNKFDTAFTLHLQFDRLFRIADLSPRP